MAEESPALESGGFLTNIFLEIVQSPLNIALVVAIAFLAYKILKRSQSVPDYEPPEPQLPKLRKDFYLEDLKKYDGLQEDGRVLVAVNGNVYDVTKGKRFYGPGGPYSAFAGRDASRGLATFSVECKTDGYDDLSDLNSMEMDSVREWEAQFKEKYEFVGRLLRPGEEPRNYSDEEEEEDSSGAGGNAVAGDTGGGDKQKNE
ncbi:hypothetical protein FQR65_LT11872 [Abscondita terminalis]|nr:hypothetical protein FQR65_LT11872 [Abscondita terminalis]